MTTKSLLTIEPNWIYDDYQIRLAMNVTDTLLCKERREGRLRSSKKGKTHYYLGQWIVDWLEGRPAEQGVANVA